MLPKQAKFDLKYVFSWGSAQTPLGGLRRSPKPPNREGKPLPFLISSYATDANQYLE